AYLSRLYIAHVHVLDHAAAHGVGLDAQHAVQMRAVHLAILRENVADVARALAAQGHAAVSVLHRAALHDDVLACRMQTAAIRVTAALDRDAVVARIERTAVD